MKDLIITGFSNVTSEGVTLKLNKKTRLAPMRIETDEFWFSWDAIGKKMFENYTELVEVADRDKLRASAKNG